MALFGCKKEQPAIYKNVKCFYSGDELIVNGVKQTGLYYMAELTGENTFTAVGDRPSLLIYINDSVEFNATGFKSLTYKIRI